MKEISGKKLAKALERHGWSLVRIKGSHFHYYKTGSKTIISIPVHGNKPLKPGLLSQILKAAGLTSDDI